MILQNSIIEKVINAGIDAGADFVEVYIENSYTSQLGIASSKPEEGLVGRDFGIGLRVFRGHEIVYTYTNSDDEKVLIDLVRKSAGALKVPVTKRELPKPLPSIKDFGLKHSFVTKPWDVTRDKKFSHLFIADRAAREFNSQVSQVTGWITEKHKEVQVANSEGTNAFETRQYTGASVQVIAEGNGNKEAAHQVTRAFKDTQFLDKIDFVTLAHKAADRAIGNLTADFAPAGELPVLIEKGSGGVIFHEASGHGLETTSVAKNASVFSGHLEKQIAHPCVTAIDDGTIAGMSGSLGMDDEGAPTQKTVLIENGILKSYIVDKMGARKTGYKATGSGRRQDYTLAPASRMRNTYIAAGDSKFEDMIADIDYGIYAKQIGGGSVSPGTGAYNFAVQEAYLVRNGRIEKRVKGAALIGTGIETLKNIVKVGDDMEMEPGTCGSVSGWVPVTCGQPAILVSKLTVGGRA